ncbi:MAG: hypothetical protein LW694_10070 [Chitinophagaceae bacterium]|nr:hypothetical protein [Chitinophagaceae bacterium]
MKSPLYTILFLSTLFSLTEQAMAQSSITGTVKGLRHPDSAVVRVQKDLYDYRFVKLRGDSAGADKTFQFPTLSNGSWALSIDAPGYRYPPAKVIALNNSTSNQTITLQKSTGGNFSTRPSPSMCSERLSLCRQISTPSTSSTNMDFC